MKQYKITFSDDYSKSEIEMVTNHINIEFPKLLRMHNEENIEIEFLSFYVENEYLYFSAAADEPRKMWFKLNRFNNFSDTIHNYLKDTLSHEFHHMIRWNYRKRFNLSELLINEGLAILFTMTINQTKCPPYIKEVTNQDVEKLLPLIKRDLYNENFNHRIWQKGNKEYGIPISFAYSFGFKLVKDFYEQNPKMDIRNSFGIDCNLFIPAYLKD